MHLSVLSDVAYRQKQSIMNNCLLANDFRAVLKLIHTDKIVHFTKFICKFNAPSNLASQTYRHFAMFSSFCLSDILELNQIAKIPFYSAIIFHASTSFSMLHAAFAGLVDGRHTASRFTVGNRYFLYSCSAFLPLRKIS